MKMKKLLSIGALTLAMTCSVSVTSFAAENVKINDAEVKVEYNDLAVMREVARKIISGKTVKVSGIEVSKDKTVGDFINDTDAVKKEIKKYHYYETYKNDPIFKKYVGMIAKDGSIASNGNKMLDQMTQKEYKHVIEVTENLIDEINNKNDGEYRRDKEKIALGLVQYTMFEGYNVSFGKNNDDSTTLSVEDKEGKIIGQVTFKNVKDLLTILKSKNVETIKAFVNGSRAK
ncbi:hypothetical protein UT300005_14810 [Clostridium sp. CTA-5]